MMTATELFNHSAEALAIAGPAEWDSPDECDSKDVLFFDPDETSEDVPLWCVAPIDSDDAEYVPVDTGMARDLISCHLRTWLLSRGWQVQVAIRKEMQRWRLVDCIWFADGGGDRLDCDYPFGDDEFCVLCESVVAVGR